MKWDWVFVLGFPMTIGFLVSYLLHEDKKEDKKRRRFFHLKKPLIILCPKHLSKLKKKELALINAEKCQVCLDKRSKM